MIIIWEYLVFLIFFLNENGQLDRVIFMFTYVFFITFLKVTMDSVQLYVLFECITTYLYFHLQPLLLYYFIFDTDICHL